MTGQTPDEEPLAPPVQASVVDRPIRERSRTSSAFGAVLLFALLATVVVAAGRYALLLVPFVPLPMALYLTEWGWRRALAPGVGLAVAALLITDGLLAGVALAALLVGLGAVIPAVISLARVDGPLGGGGFPAVAAATCVVLALATAASTARVGIDDVQRRAAAEARAMYEPSLRSCSRDGVLASSGASCDDLRSQQRQVVRTVREHTVGVLAGLVVLLGIGIGGASLWLARWFAARRGVGMTRPVRLSGFRMHWSVAYVLAGGLTAVMAAGALTTLASPLGVVGIAVTTGAGAIVLAQGIAVAQWLLERWRLRWFARMAAWLLLLFVQPLGLGILGLLALLDSSLGLRDRAPGDAGRA